MAASSPPIGSYAELIDHFRRGCKSSGQLAVGLEHEKIGVVVEPGDGGRSRVRPLPYSDEPGRPQIRALFDGLMQKGWQPVYEGELIIALKGHGGSVTLEPGGQFELSGPPMPSAGPAAADLDAHLRDLLPLANSLGIRFLGCGFRPLGTWDDVPWVPKGRYRVMREYLPTRGRLGVEMMKRTATVQANLDYVSEEDAILKMRVGLGLSPLVTALFAASPLVDGKLSDYQSFRASCWLDTDPDRCGFLPFLFRDGAGFQDYAEWALDVPMFFVYRGGQYRPSPGLSFRAFLRDGFEGATATLADWELHLSTLFPDARLKQYVELRSADAGPLEMERALPALWQGLYYDAEALAAAWQLCAGWSIEERDALRREVPRLGYRTRLRGQEIGGLCEELVAIARQGLVRIGGEAELLDPLLEQARARRCPADAIREAFLASGGDEAAFVEKIRLRLPGT